MTAYFSQLLAQTGLPAAPTGGAPVNPGSGGAALSEPQTGLPGEPGAMDAASSLNGPDSLLAEIDTTVEAPGPTSSPATLPPAPASLPTPERPAWQAGYPQPEPDARQVRPPEPVEQAETRISSSGPVGPQPPAGEKALPETWLSAFQKARDWVSAGPALPTPLEQRQEIETQAASPQPDARLGRPAAEGEPPQVRIEAQTIVREGNTGPREAFGAEREPRQAPLDFALPLHTEQHQELNLTIGSIVVTVEGSPAPPAARPVGQNEPGAAKQQRANRRGEAGGRLSRHYLRLG